MILVNYPGGAANWHSEEICILVEVNCSHPVTAFSLRTTEKKEFVQTVGCHGSTSKMHQQTVRDNNLCNTVVVRQQAFEFIAANFKNV